MPHVITNATVNGPQGWTSSPDGRGTVDIIWTCLFTISLCIWSVLCVNIAAPGDGYWRKLSYKMLLAGLSLTFPDLLLVLALGQWESASRSITEFQSLGYSHWSMKHAFFVDMGGFVIETGDGISWPLDSRELYYLIAEGWIKDPMISNQIMLEKDVIEDKNKIDIIIRFITFVQILWFIINCIGRACQHLATTTLELTTVGLVITTVPAMFFWVHKPTDINIPTRLKIETTIVDIHHRAGPVASTPWYDTPLDFIKPEKTYVFVGWIWHVSLLQKLHLAPIRKTRIIQRRREDDFLILSFRAKLFLGATGIGSFAINFIPWKFWFPSTVECYLWRTSSLTLLAVFLIAAFYHEILIYLLPAVQVRTRESFIARRGELEARAPHNQSRWTIRERTVSACKNFLKKLQNISPNQDPSVTVPMRLLIPMMICAFSYSIARMYILVEDLIALRAQSPDVYNTVDWWELFPHV